MRSSHARSTGSCDEDAEWVKAHLRPLIGQAAAEPRSGSRDEAFAAWRRFFEAMAEQHPLVLVFEDVQWADDGLLDFVEYLVDWVRGVPMFDPLHRRASSCSSAGRRGVGAR